jgi:hypothetical protein
MAKINLLPPDLGPSASVLKFINFAKKITIILGLIFFVCGTLLVGYILVLKMEVQASVKRSDGLKSSISAFKQTEQSLYLLKERIGKVKSLFAKETSDQSLASSSSLFVSHSGINLTQATTSQGKISVSGSSQSTSSLGNFFESIIANDSYANIKLTSFIFNPKTGYVFSLDFSLK